MGQDESDLRGEQDEGIEVEIVWACDALSLYDEAYPPSLVGHNSSKPIGSR